MRLKGRMHTAIGWINGRPQAMESDLRRLWTLVAAPVAIRFRPRSVGQYVAAKPSSDDVQDDGASRPVRNTIAFGRRYGQWLGAVHIELGITRDNHAPHAAISSSQRQCRTGVGTQRADAHKFWLRINSRCRAACPYLRTLHRARHANVDRGPSAAWASTIWQPHFCRFAA